uniref:Prolactin releasing hormone n=1 Tax=Myripristis murdjan TaxID=586833 RepID=A0A668AHL9_9TELE
AMRVCAVLCALLLLLSHTLCRPHRGGTMDIRNIDASWYTGRGIRPVGRFGRKVIDIDTDTRHRHQAFITPRVYTPTANTAREVWVTQ